MFANSVAMLVESSYEPLYQQSFIPWYHFVPVKKDLSDLLSSIEWLRQNDEEAQKIARNGNSLYKQLFDIQNMIEDSAFVFQKYADMMTYEP
jgi:hypothetical protein